MSARDRKIISMWLDGVRSKEIAAELGIARGAMLRDVRRLGLPLRSTSNSQQNLRPLIEMWASKGYRACPIAALIGCQSPDPLVLDEIDRWLVGKVAA